MWRPNHVRMQTPGWHRPDRTNGGSDRVDPAWRDIVVLAPYVVVWALDVAHAVREVCRDSREVYR